jgi:hypothetical protein
MLDGNMPQCRRTLWHPMPLTAPSHHTRRTSLCMGVHHTRRTSLCMGVHHTTGTCAWGCITQRETSLCMGLPPKTSGVFSCLQ